MLLKLVEYGILFFGAIPFIYYFLGDFQFHAAIFCCARKHSLENRDFTPPSAILSLYAAWIRKPTKISPVYAARIIPSTN